MQRRSLSPIQWEGLSTPLPICENGDQIFEGVWYTHSSHVFKAPLLIWRGLFCPEKGFGMSKAEQERFSLWRNRDYLLLWGGQVISMTGSQVSQLVFPLLILALTHSPAQTGIAAALQSLPYLILSLPAGALVDRWNRKRVMIFCNLRRFLSVASVNP